MLRRVPTSGDDQLLRRRIGALAALAAVLVGSAGCGGSDDQEQGNLTRGEKQAQAVAEEVLAAVRVVDRRTVCALLTHRIRRVEAGSGGAGLVGRCARKIDRRAEHLPARDAQIESASTPTIPRSTSTSQTARGWS